MARPVLQPFAPPPPPPLWTPGALLGSEPWDPRVPGSPHNHSHGGPQPWAKGGVTPPPRPRDIRGCSGQGRGMGRRGEGPHRSWRGAGGRCGGGGGLGHVWFGALWTVLRRRSWGLYGTALSLGGGGGPGLGPPWPRRRGTVRPITYERGGGSGRGVTGPGHERHGPGEGPGRTPGVAMKKKKKKLGVSNTPYDGGRWVTDGGWWVTDGGRWVTDGGWWVTDGGWCVIDGGWWVTDGVGG